MTFEVDDLEAYNRSGNWIYDADSPGFPTHDGDWFTFSPALDYVYHYYAEKYIHDNGTTTSLVCIGENVPLADNPGELDMVFTEFEMVAFERINTVDPLAPWDTPGQSADERVYANATGYISHNGANVLTIDFATFVITTPYPNEAQVQALSPLLSSWTGDIGTGAPQTGYGFGDLDLANCDPDWAALFAGSDYKVQMNMVGITSTVTPSYGWFDFDLEVLPAPVPYQANNTYLDLAALPQSIDYPLISAGLDVFAGTPAGEYDDMQHVYLNEIGIAPSGALPGGVDVTLAKYWELGTTLSTFGLNMRFSVDGTQLPGPAEDWRILYRETQHHPWVIWDDYTLVNPNLIQANNVSQIGEFTVASLEEQNVPVELSSFTATSTAEEYVRLDWTSQTESQMIGYRVYRNPSDDQASAQLIDHPLVPATNTSTLQSYSVTDLDVETGNTYYYWLEALDYGNSAYFGPVSVTVEGNVPPVLPEATSMRNAYPNPFKANTSIEVALKAGETGTVEIYNMLGQHVRTFTVSEGTHTVNWDGKNTRGDACGSGIYFYKLNTPSFSQTRKLIISK
ncbi:MAG: T9SS type A sorting domain-containing protein [Candidatus Syntrophosphaera sp.]